MYQQKRGIWSASSCKGLDAADAGSGAGYAGVLGTWMDLLRDCIQLTSHWQLTQSEKDDLNQNGGPQLLRTWESGGQKGGFRVQMWIQAGILQLSIH